MIESKALGKSAHKGTRQRFKTETHRVNSFSEPPTYRDKNDAPKQVGKKIEGLENLIMEF